MTRDRVSLYVRLSRAADDENLSLKGMTEELQAYVAKLKLREVAIHVDDGLSGGYRDRPAFQAWIADARNGRCDVLATPHVDRLTREGLNVAASLLDVVEGKDPATGRPAHAPVRLMDMQGIDSEHGDAFRMRFVIQAEVGRSERERIRDRARKSVKRVRAANRWPGGVLPFGYRAVPNPDGAGTILEPDPEEAAALRECAQRVLGGQGLSAVSLWLNTQDVKPRRAKSFSRQTLRIALTGTAATGRIKSGGQILPGVQFEPVLSAAESAALNKLLAPTPGAKFTGGRQPARLLSGLLRCYSCESVLYVWHRDDRLAYRCNKRGVGQACESPVTVNCVPIEKYITGEVLSLLGDKPMTRQEVRVSGGGDIAAVEQEIQDVLMQVAQAATAENVSRLQALQQERDELRAIEPETEVVTVDLGMSGAEWWEQAQLSERRDLVGNIWPHILLLPGKRGGGGFNPARVALHKEPDYAYEAWLQEQ